MSRDNKDNHMKQDSFDAKAAQKDQNQKQSLDVDAKRQPLISGDKTG